MGIKLNCEINVKHNYKRFDEIKKRLAQSIGLEDVLKNLQGCAIRLERGRNEEGIIVEMVEGSTGKVKRKSLC